MVAGTAAPGSVPVLDFPPCRPTHHAARSPARRSGGAEKPRGISPATASTPPLSARGPDRRPGPALNRPAAYLVAFPAKTGIQEPPHGQKALRAEVRPGQTSAIAAAGPSRRRGTRTGREAGH